MLLVLAAIASLLAEPQAADGRNPDPLLGPPARVTIATSATALPSGLRLLATVTPMPGIHLYAPGNQGLHRRVVRDDVACWMESGQSGFPRRRARTCSASSRNSSTSTGRPSSLRRRSRHRHRGDRNRRRSLDAEYQACTDRVCYPPQEQTVTVVLPASLARQESRRPSAERNRLSGTGRFVQRHQRGRVAARVGEADAGRRAVQDCVRHILHLTS